MTTQPPQGGNTGMNKNLLDTLKDEIANLTRLQRSVADCILKNPMQATFSTVEQLAQAAGTSTTTVMRLATHMGYSGFADFQRDLQELLKSRAAPSQKMELNLGDQTPADNLATEVARLQIDNINKTFASLDDETIYKAEKIISGARHIYVCGGRSCYSVAHYLTFNLDRMFNKSDLVIPIAGELGDKIRRFRPGVAVIAITMPRYNRIVVDVARHAKENGASVIAITDGYGSPLSQYADLLFNADCKSSAFHNSMVTSMLISDMIIAACARKNYKLVHENLKQAEEYMQSRDVMMTP